MFTFPHSLISHIFYSILIWHICLPSLQDQGFPCGFFIPFCLTHSFLIITRSSTIHYLCELFYSQYPLFFFHFTYKFPFSKYIPLIACFWIPGFYMKSKLYTKTKYLKVGSTYERGHATFLLWPSLYSFNFPVLTICIQISWLHLSLQFHNIPLYTLLYFHYVFISQKTIWENWIPNYCKYTGTEHRYTKILMERDKAT